MSRLQQLKSASNVVMEFDYKQGHAYDKDGGHTPTFGTTYFTRGGANFDGTNSRFDYSVSGELNTALISFVVEFTPDFAPGDDVSKYLYDCTNGARFAILKSNNAGSNNLSVVMGDTNIQNITEATYTGSWKVGQKNILVVTGDATNDSTNVWLNGNQILTNDNTPWVVANPSVFYIGSAFNNGEKFEGNIGYLGIFNKLLSATEISEITAELSARKYSSKTQEEIRRNTKANLSDSTIRGAWDLKTVNGTVIDDGPGNHTGAINGSPAFGKNHIGNFSDLGGVADYVGITDSDDFSFGDGSDDSPFTVSAWIKTDELTNFAIVSKGVLNTDGEWRLVFTSSDKIIFYIKDESGANTYRGRFFDQVLTHIEGVWTHVVSTYNGVGGTNAQDGMKVYINGLRVDDTTDSNGTYVAMENLTHEVWIGRYSNFYAKGKILNPQIFSEEKDAAWMLAEYNRGARAVQYKTDYGATQSVAGVTAGELENTGWTVNSGTWKVSTDTINGQPVKVFNCVASGVLYIPIDQFMTSTEAAYGSWEFWLYKGDETSIPSVRFVSTSAAGNGYSILILNTEAILLFEDGTGAIDSTATGAMPIQTWVNFKVTRQSNGLMTVYQDGVQILSGTDTTFTTSSFISISFSAGDKISVSDLKGDHAFTKYLGAVAP